MIDDIFFDEMNLPFTNSNEELETISNNLFKPLFDTTKFEIRSQEYRDKGIDFHIEIKRTNLKKESVYLNFNFAIQLKATDRKETNHDGSISLQIDTSNINYLLNNPMPAYYVLYFKSTNTFYFESINDFARSLYEKDADWNSQASHVLRFDKELDQSRIEEMYQSTLKKGKFQRQINEKIALQTSSINPGDKISFDADLNVTDDSEIRRLIESVGHVLINEGKWKDIIHIHKKATGNVATTARYNLVLGVANYYCGNLVESLGFFKDATNLKTELPEDLLNHLRFFETIVKYSIGLLSEEEYFKRMDKLENFDNLGLYIKLEKAKKNYLESVSQNSANGYDAYVKDVQSIINDPNANESIILNAKCELILFEGFKNNMEYIQGVSMINAIEQGIGPNLKLRQDAFARFTQANENWFKNVQALKTAANEAKNYFAYFTTIVSEVRVTFEFEVFTDLVFIVEELPGVPRPAEPDRKPTFDKMLDKITNAVNYFKQIGHIENVVAALTTKYEIYHFLKEIEIANSIIDELENIVETYDLHEQRGKLEILKKNGTNHEQFKVFMNHIFENSDSIINEHKGLTEEMIRMDESERKDKVKLEGNILHIHLYPIGYFDYPESQKAVVYEILNIIPEARKMFESMIGIAIPVANIYHNPITQEGFSDGELADKGIENWRNVYRIRKIFFENKFYRNENIPY